MGKDNTKIISYLVLFILVISLSGCVQYNRKISTSTNTSNEIVIGALLPLTGELSFSGRAAKAALELAAEDIEANGMKVRLVIEDTESNPSVALEKLQKLKKSGIIFVIGPDSSKELEAVKPYADEKGIILISHGSTAHSLAIAGDNVFRLLPDDTHQAEAMAALMWKDGIRIVVPVWRGDVWGDGLSEATKTRFENLGGTVPDGIRYEQGTDFSSELDTMSSKVSQAVNKYGKDKVAVHFIGFNEVVTLFTKAQNQSANSNTSSLSEVKWYGSDGTAFDDDLLNNAEAARFAAETNFSNPFCSIEIKDIEEMVKEREGTAHPFGIIAYDALWLATLTYIDSNKSADINVLKKTLIRTAASFSGATGSTEFNEAGDRKFASYDFWVIKEKHGLFTWERAAKYPFDSLTNQD
ncbi:MAG: penicillin-binding protein activator [Candidatus Methanoperedens sp.]|nr:penicillin-binding protein activator [Candidatus Methanoperedens sp.]MCZ7369304.1 penicillin-binding protein activator [Candidatus Methanoperedens sp.]